jgi:isopentenyl diphosphate isomerase/L-lactate dehydrogenase-like FMN-dependent dehydrogenase
VFVHPSKEVLHRCAARRWQRGVDSVAVSNHTGRPVNSEAASLDALECVANASGAQTTVLFDSGVRAAANMLKAQVLGAQFVFGVVDKLGIWELRVVG